MLRRSFARFHQSAFLTDIYTLPQLKAGDTVTLRARVQNSRVKGKLGFLHLRQPGNCSVQVVVADNADLIQTAKNLTKESIVEVSGKIQNPSKPIASTSCSNVELAATELRVVSERSHRSRFHSVIEPPSSILGWITGPTICAPRRMVPSSASSRMSSSYIVAS
jgi:aspartyl/asparaginyl-tRNA synthetase